MKKIILSIITGCFFLSYAEYVAIIELPTINETIKPPIEPEIPTPGGCDGTGIMKIKNIINDGKTWEDTMLSQTNAEFLYLNNDSFYEIHNDCWGNSPTGKIERFVLGTARPLNKSFLDSNRKEKWNDANVLYLRIVGINETLPSLKAIFDERANSYFMGSKGGEPEKDADIDKWRYYLIDNKIIEYSIQFSEVPYNGEKQI